MNFSIKYTLLIKAFMKKYHRKILNSHALGDAYAVAIAYIKNNKEE